MNIIVGDYCGFIIAPVDNQERYKELILASKNFQLLALLETLRVRDQQRLRLRLLLLRDAVQHIQDAMVPAALLVCVRKHVSDRSPDTEMTVTDPVNLTEPWVLRRDKVYSEGYEFIENECRPPLRERPSN